MSPTMLLRGVAVGMAIVGLIDPAITWQQKSPLPVTVIAASPSASERELANEVTQEIRRRLGDAVELDSPHPPAAVVLVGESPDSVNVKDNVAVSLVSKVRGANVSIDAVTRPESAIVGRTALVIASVRGLGTQGTKSTIALEYETGELARVEHEWVTDDEVFEARFEHVPPAPGVQAFRIVARPAEREVNTADNHADFRLVTEDRRFKVLVHEPRPSWAAAFVRRALEEQPLFHVAGLTRSSRGIAVRAGNPPERLSEEALGGFDVVIVGSPEELRGVELDALSHFTRIRGGAVIFLPDRRPQGPFAKRVLAAATQGASEFEEVLLERPATIQGKAGTLRGSEFAVLRALQPGVDVLAALPYRQDLLPVVVTWPDGFGRTVYAGALDAWRFRAEGEAFAQFWRTHMADAAAAAPPRLAVSLNPGVASPGQRVQLTARVRPSELTGRAPRELPTISARIMDERGAVEPIRLWPTAEPGLFEGTFAASGIGRYLVQVAGTAVVDTVLLVTDDARAPSVGSPQSLRQLASATGGVAVEIADLEPLELHLSSVPRSSTTIAAHPARSIWWGSAFIALACGEWWLRRRRGAA